MENIGFLESIVYSLVGLIIVFIALSTLAVSIVLSTKLFQVLGFTEEKVAPTKAPQKKEANLDKPFENLNEEEFAIIIAAVTQEASSSGNYQVKSITEIK